MIVKDFLKTAIIYNNQKLMYSELIEKIERYSAFLDVREDEKVILFAPNRPEWIIALFAIWKKNAIAVPVDFHSSPQEIAAIIDDCKSSVILAAHESQESLQKALLLSKHKPSVVFFEEIPANIGSFKNPGPKSSQAALILYTSGTTGNPKGVMLSFENLESNIKSIITERIASSDDRILSLLPFHHSYPLMITILVPLALGATIVIIDKPSSQAILEALQKNKITIFVGVPRIFALFHKTIMQQISQTLVARGLFWLARKSKNPAIGRMLFHKVHQTFGGHIRYFISGGAKLDEEVARDFWALGFKIIEGYGLTETSPIATFNPPSAIRLGTVGKAIEGVVIAIKEEEVLIKGPNVMLGYLGKEKETAEAIKEGWFYTGDLGHLDEKGYLVITGRKKELIVLPSGKNIQPEEIESALQKTSNLIKEVAVTLKEGGLFAVVHPDLEVAKSRGLLNIHEAIKWEVIDAYNLASPPHKRITGFVIVKNELPKTRLGKIRRFMLDEFLHGEKEAKAPEAEPSDEIYALLKNYLATLAQRPITPSSHIQIDLGIDSLGLVELQSFIEGSFGVQITEKEMAKLLTVLELYRFIEGQKTRLEEEAIDWHRLLQKEVSADLAKNTLALCSAKIPLYLMAKGYLALSIRGVENLPDRPFILAPNHQSYLDGFLIAAALPWPILAKTYFVAEEKFFASAWRKNTARLFHILPINIQKNLKDSLLKSAQILKEHKNLVLFPEGARSRDGRVTPFKKFFAILAKELDVSIVPVAIAGAYDAYPVGQRFPKPTHVTLTFLKPVTPADATYEEIARRCEQAVKEELGNG